MLPAVVVSLAPRLVGKAAMAAPTIMPVLLQTKNERSASPNEYVPPSNTVETVSEYPDAIPMTKLAARAPPAYSLIYTAAVGKRYSAAREIARGIKKNANWPSGSV